MSASTCTSLPAFREFELWVSTAMGLGENSSRVSVAVGEED